MGLFSFLQAPKPDLQLYGKLPIAKDYLRIGLSEETGVNFRGWLDQHFSTGVERGAATRLTWPVGFVLGEGDGNPLVGCMWDSSDAGGHRKFPFSLSVLRKRKDLAAAFTGGMPSILACWQRLEEFRARALTCSDGEELMAELRGRELPAEETLTKQGRNVALEPWTAGLWPESGTAGVRDALASLRAAHSDASVRTVRCSLMPGLGWTQQVQAWGLLLEQAGWIGGPESPNIFAHYTAKGASGDGATPAPPAIFLSRDPLNAADAFRLCGVEEEWGGAGALELGARQSTGSPDDETAALYPVECSLSQAIAGELGF